MKPASQPGLCNPCQCIVRRKKSWVHFFEYLMAISGQVGHRGGTLAVGTLRCKHSCTLATPYG